MSHPTYDTSVGAGASIIKSQAKVLNGKIAPGLEYSSIRAEQSYSHPPRIDELTYTKARARQDYAIAQELPQPLEEKYAKSTADALARKRSVKTNQLKVTRSTAYTFPPDRSSDHAHHLLMDQPMSLQEKSSASVTARTPDANKAGNGGRIVDQQSSSFKEIMRRDHASKPSFRWHAPWKLMRVISGHLGWVRSLAVEPGNQWFASGAGDRTIKIWDLASGALRLTLTGHISTVRGLAVSPRHPYLFSCGEDKMVKCWDLETNKVIRHYHGHLSGVYTLSLHPSLDVLVTGGRDGVARVWDMRTRSNIHVLSGHKQTVADVKCQEVDPQVITASLDSTIRMWDLAAGKSLAVLTHHKKGVRSLAIHPTEFTFASGSTGAIKQWKFPEGGFMQNFEGHNAVINTLSANEDDVLISGGDDGSMSFWDWKTGSKFQSMQSIAQPGSLDAEAGLMSSTFDRTGLRFICGEADKTIKMWKPDDEATPESYPLQLSPTLSRQKF